MFRPESTKSISARPLISDAEEDRADDAICTLHRGVGPWKDGEAYWCPIGRQYWRYRKQAQDGFRGRLIYPKLGIT